MVLYQRADGRWIAVVDLGWEGGRRRREVASKLADALREHRGGHSLPNERMTFAAFLDSWLIAVRPTIQPATWQRYEQYGRLHSIPMLGKRRLSTIGPVDLQLLYANRIAAGSSPTTVRHLHRFLHRVFDQAVRWGVTARNPVTLVDPPRVSRHQCQTLDSEQARSLLGALNGDRLQALSVVALTTGMRQGELLALRWADLDLATSRVAVQGSLHRDPGGGWSIRGPKTERSRRQVLLPALAVRALERHRLRQSTERLRM